MAVLVVFLFEARAIPVCSGSQSGYSFSVWESSTAETLPISDNSLNPGLKQSISGQRIVSPTEHYRADAVRDIFYQSARVRPKLDC